MIVPLQYFFPTSESNLARIIAGLFRWDSVYFISLADRREYVWEQEWAFGPGWPALIQYTTPCTHSSSIVVADG